MRLMTCLSMGIVLVACAPERDDLGTAPGSATAAGGASTGGGGSGAVGGTSVGAGNAAGAAAGGSTTGFETDEVPGRLEPDAGCEALAVQGETVTEIVEVPVTEEIVVPSVFYIMQDRSGSMVTDPFSLAGAIVGGILCLIDPNACPQPGTQPMTPTKWTYAVDGLNDFVNDPDSAGIELALNYFPQGGQCDGSGYDMPAVPMGPLPANGANISASLGQQVPGGGTPIEGALRGVTGYCLDYNAQNADKNCVSVLITDGQPSDCAEDSGALAQIAADAAAQGVITFAAGMEGADFNLLDQIARAGGGNCNPSGGSWACDLTASPTAFAEALIRIRESVETTTRIETTTEEVLTTVPCEWQIPDPPEGKTFDKGLVNVEFSVAGGLKQVIGAVANQAACANAADGGGWFYDNPDQPTAIKVCDATCSAIQASNDARVDIQLGCVTRPAAAR